MFNDLAKRLGIETTALRYWGDKWHMVPLAKIDGEWRYFDTDLEFKRTDNKLSSILDDRVLADGYRQSQIAKDEDYVRGLQSAIDDDRIEIEDPGTKRAWRGRALHDVVHFLSYHGWAAWLALWAVLSIFGLRRSLTKRAAGKLG